MLWEASVCCCFYIGAYFSSFYKIQDLNICKFRFNFEFVIFGLNCMPALQIFLGTKLSQQQEQ